MIGGKFTMAQSPITFNDYEKITDILIYFSTDIILKFVVQLARKDQDGRRRFFHRETTYESKYTNVGAVTSITRDVNFFFLIDDKRNYMDGVLIGVQDIVFLKMLIENQILPWFIGDNSIFNLSPDNTMVISGVYEPKQFTLSDYKYLEFHPLVITYDDGKSNYGIRMIINRPDNFVDMDLNKFMAFYYIITTDMYSIASNLMCYTKTEPYGINEFNMATDTKRNVYNTNRDPNKKGFFDK